MIGEVLGRFKQSSGSQKHNISDLISIIKIVLLDDAQILRQAILLSNLLSVKENKDCVLP